MASNGVTALMLLGLAMPFAVQAQGMEDIDKIRAEQRRLASEAGISIDLTDRRGRSLSVFEGALPELLDLFVANEQQLIDAIVPDVYKYFGLTGSETLEFKGKTQSEDYPGYYFQEYINGFAAPNFLHVLVDPTSNKVIKIAADLQIDRGYALEPAMREQEALDLALAFFKERNKKHLDKVDPASIEAVESKIVYIIPRGGEGMQPAWQFLIPAVDFAAPMLDEYTVYPDGMVEGGYRRM